MSALGVSRLTVSSMANVKSRTMAASTKEESINVSNAHSV